MNMSLYFFEHIFSAIVKYRIKHHTIPFLQSFHIGGPATVRGFTLGPNWTNIS